MARAKKILRELSLNDSSDELDTKQSETVEPELIKEVEQAPSPQASPLAEETHAKPKKTRTKKVPDNNGIAAPEPLKKPARKRVKTSEPKIVLPRVIGSINEGALRRKIEQEFREKQKAEQERERAHEEKIRRLVDDRWNSHLAAIKVKEMGYSRPKQRYDESSEEDEDAEEDFREEPEPPTRMRAYSNLYSKIFPNH